MKKFSIILLKILGVVLILSGLGVILSTVHVASIVAEQLAKEEIVRASLSAVILIFIWIIGVFMSLVGIRFLNKKSNKLVDHITEE